MTTSSADFDPNDIHQLLQPYSASSSAWSAASIDHTSQNSAYAESLTTASDVSWSPSVATHYTTSSGSTERTKSSAFSVPRSEITSITAPSLGPAQSMVGANHAPVGDGYGEPFELWCEFRDILECDTVFAGDNEYGWIQHHIRHLGGRFPSEVVCWFCDHVPFKAKHSADRRAMFELRMQHIREHIRGDYFTVSHMRPDFHLLEDMCRHGQLDRETFEGLRVYTEVPSQFRLPKDDFETTPYTQVQSGQVYYYNQEQEDRRRRREQKEQKQQSPSKRRIR